VGTTALALVLIAAACGDDDDDGDDAGSSGAETSAATEASTPDTQSSGADTTAATEASTPESSGTDTTVAADEGPLGAPNAASGEPIRWGFVSDGRTPALDNTHHAPAAQATVDYINDHLGGLAGRPIELVTCETEGDPGRATDCANLLVQEGVVLTLMPENQQPLAVHTVMSANGIPLFVYGVAEPAITEDAENSFMIASLTAGLSALPIDVAQENDIDNVTVFVVDVPAATEFYENFGAAQFEEAGIALNLVRIPLGAPDISPQVNDVVTGDPTVLHIIGDPGLCINALNGLRNNGFEGPITIINSCVGEAVTTAVGDNMDGVIMAAPTPIGDTTNSGIQLWNAILEEYAPDYEDPTEGLTTFITTISARQALEELTGEITPDNLRTTIHSAPSQPLITGNGLEFRCNGQAAPQTPAVCTRGALRVTLDAEGQPNLPYEPFGNSPIPD
jgi:branched-chain amino acid transport system substrate-binding protein